jgi:hypothetical protein
MKDKFKAKFEGVVQLKEGLFIFTCVLLFTIKGRPIYIYLCFAFLSAEDSLKMFIVLKKELRRKEKFEYTEESTHL